MKKRPFYFEIKTAVTQFMAAFNNIFIKRYDKDRNVITDDIPVSFVYGPKSRVIEDIINPSKSIVLPAVNVSISSIQRDPERVFNKIEGHHITTTTYTDKVRHIPQPVPINIGINLSIIARYQEDIEQILSNVTAYCDPYIIISWKLPTTENSTYEQEIRTVVEWSGTFDIKFPTELSNNQLARLTADTTFNIRTWLFKHINTNYSKIYNVSSTLAATISAEECFVFNNITDQINYSINSDPISSSFVVQGRPFIKSASTSSISIESTRNYNTPISLYGDNFNRLEYVYITPMVSNPQDPLIDFLQNTNLYVNATSGMQVRYPPFNGYRIDNYKIITDNRVDIYIPPPLKPGEYFDVIFANEAGYTRLSVDSYITPLSSEYSWQSPFYNKGIFVQP